jgi:RHS repeat-associated protein
MASSNPYRYAGYSYDEETGLYYLMSRYYDPEVGRFLTRDTSHGFADDPQSLNLYAYTKNNPVKFTDPDGHWIWVAAQAAYGAYTGYKEAKANGQSGWSMAGTIALSAASEAVSIGKVVKVAKFASKALKT